MNPKRAGMIMAALMLLFQATCKKTAFFAPADAILNLFADQTYLKTGGDKAQLTILGFTADGEPLHDHTTVILTATMGQVTPMDVELIGGKATAEFISPDRSGVAQVTARSGSAVSNPPLEITIGSAGLSTLSIIAEPAHFSPGGGHSYITVFAFDASGNPLADISVILSATSGSFVYGGGLQKTDANGRIAAKLDVETDTTVKAKSGDKEATVEIRVDTNQPPVADFTISPPSPLKGETVYFNGELSKDPDGYIVSYSWDFGDGYFGSGARVTHVYTWSGTDDKSFNVVLKVTDNNGASHFVQKTLTVKGV